jgi:hypothetical protein
MWLLPDNLYIRQLLDSRGRDEAVVDREVKQAILTLRFWRAVEPCIALFRPAARFIRHVWKEKIYGRYRKSFAQAHGGANQAPGPGAGTGGLAALSPGPNFAFSTFSAFSAVAGTAATLVGTTTPTIQDAGIRAGEIVGYRCWHLNSDGLLYSMFRSDFVWRPGEIVEGDVAEEGVHAFKDRLAVGSYGYTRNNTRVVVSGTVYLWGEVIEHERGWRASKAAIASIDDSPYYDARELRRKYGLTRKRAKKK